MTAQPKLAVKWAPGRSSAGVVEMGPMKRKASLSGTAVLYKEGLAVVQLAQPP